MMRGLLGYMHNELRGYPVESLTSMRVAFPSGDRASAGFAFEFLQWLITERKCSPYYELCAVRAFIAAAKFLHGGGLQEHGDLDRPYDHVPLIRQLRKIAKETGRRAAVATPAADTRKKWLTWEQFMNVVATLEVECRPVNRTYAAGKKDLSPRSIAWVVQRYLIFGILSCIPDRQRTIRELEIGRTLFKEDIDPVAGPSSDVAGPSSDVAKLSPDVSGPSPDVAGLSPSSPFATPKGGYTYRWVIRHGPDDYKTGKIYGERSPLLIHPSLYPALEEFAYSLRDNFEPTGTALFCTKGGLPLTGDAVYRMITTTTFRLTGRQMNPHLIRDMIITHLRGTDASERELEALAIYMGHSLAMQKGTYDRRTKDDKVAPAVDLLASLNSRWTDRPKP
jgi:hypothetical protein